MKTKNNLRIFTLSSVLCLFPIILSFVMYKDLPEQIAVHWDYAGKPDVFFPKALAAFGLPFLFLIINIISKIFLYNDPKRIENRHPKIMQMIANWTPPLLSLVLMPVILYMAIGMNLPIVVTASVFAGVFLIICGNYLPKCRQNFTIGIKLPWTLHDADNWNKTHRMAGYLYILGGIAMIAGTFISMDGMLGGISFIFFIMIPLVIFPIIYSFLLYKKNNGTGKQDTEN